MTQVVTGNTKNGYKAADPRLIRLQNTENGQFLHLSGQGDTRDETWAWIGYRHQAKTLAERAEISGDRWPYKVVGREE